MIQGQRSVRVIQFGAFELRTDTGELRKHGTKVRLQGKPLQLLHALVERPGALVTRDELRERLWAADTFVDFESGLNTTVNRLRLALGDSADHPRYIETLARSGYRFVAPVVENGPWPAEDELVTPAAAPPTLEIVPPPPPRRARRWPWMAAAALVLILLLGAAGVVLLRRAPAAEPTFHQLTFRRTTIRSARFGPDGQSVIYEGRESPKSRELYLVSLISPESRPLGFPGALLEAVSRSGDLALINFDDKGGRNLVRVPMNGDTVMPLDRSIWAADWAPDGSKMAVIRYGGRQATLEYPRGKAVYQSSGWLSDVRVSPSGNEVAFMEHPIMGDDGGSIVAIDSKGAPHTLSAGWASAEGLAWGPTGREVWFTAARSGVTRALYCSNLAGKQRLIAAFPGTLTLFDVSPSGRVLMARAQTHAMMTGLFDSNPKERDLSWFDYSHVVDISTDGSVILFDETGEGGGLHHSVYIRRAGAHSAVRAGDGYGMAMSPDGNWAVTRPDGNDTTLNLVPLTPGQPRAISGHGLKYEFARFFPAGDRLLVVGSMAGAAPQLFWQALDGSKPVALRSGIYISRPAISPDGQRIAGVDGTQRLVVLPVDGGEPKVISPHFTPVVLCWSHAGNSLLAQSEGVPAELVRVDLETGRYKPWKEIAPFHLTGVAMIWPAALSADEHTVVYSFAQILSELFVVDGWR